MLGKIYNVIYKNTDLTEEQCFDVTNAVLDEVEDQGMLPPPYFRQSAIYTELMPFVSVEHDKFTAVNEWEDEHGKN